MSIGGSPTHFQALPVLEPCETPLHLHWDHLVLHRGLPLSRNFHRPTVVGNRICRSWGFDTPLLCLVMITVVSYSSHGYQLVVMWSPSPIPCPRQKPNWRGHWQLTKPSIIQHLGGCNESNHSPLRSSNKHYTSNIRAEPVTKHVTIALLQKRCGVWRNAAQLQLEMLTAHSCVPLRGHMN